MSWHVDDLKSSSPCGCAGCRGGADGRALALWIVAVVLGINLFLGWWLWWTPVVGIVPPTRPWLLR